MKYPIRGWIRSVLAVALGFVMAFCLVSCDFFREREENKEEQTPPDITEDPADDVIDPLDEEDFLQAEGELVKNRKGETVMLRGINAGGLFVTENWMNGFENVSDGEIRTQDFRSISRVFIKRFGFERAQALWKAYQENWWGDVDFENCAAMGMNCIRLPFTYMTVDFDAVESYDNAGDYDFSMLDAFVEKAAALGMYTILDLHGAYGSQNGQDHSGEVKSPSNVDFYQNSRMIGLTVDLWAALAEHYKDNPAVAGYDILNEPGERLDEGTMTTTDRHFAVFDKIYDAIRAQGDEHIVIFESCWDGKDLPAPSAYGWENCMYSFHHYSNMSGDGQYTAHGQSWNEKIKGVTKMDFGVPLHMGEFNNYGNAEQWEYVLGLLNRLGWHWSDWAYKINNNWENTAWGIYTIPAPDKVNPVSDSYETILRKFSVLRTTNETHRVVLGGKTLESIMKEFCTAPTQTPPAAGSYILYDAVNDYPLISNGSDVLLTTDRNAGNNFYLEYSAEGDGTLTVATQFGGYWSVVGDRVCIGMTANASARFYPVETEYGTAFISYTTCRFLRFDGEGVLRADGKDADGSAVFYFKG